MKIEAGAVMFLKEEERQGIEDEEEENEKVEARMIGTKRDCFT